MIVSFLVLTCALAVEPVVELQPIHAFHRQLSDALKAESQAGSRAKQAEIVRRMCELHSQMVRDPRFQSSDALKQYRGQLWSRLTKIKASLKQQLAREASVASDNKMSAALEAADDFMVAATTSLADSLAIFDQAQAGPGQWAALGGGPFAPDWGPDLVELIERTINPSFWDVAGGPGTIVYYRPLQCLVVRATSEVHGRVGGVVGDLRGAGK